MQMKIDLQMKIDCTNIGLAKLIIILFK